MKEYYINDKVVTPKDAKKVLNDCSKSMIKIFSIISD